MTSPSNPRILVTRSGADGQRLAQKVERLGCLAIHCPAVILTGPDNPDSVRRAILRQPKPDGVIITSPAGLVEAVSLLGVPWFNRQLLVVPGEATAKRARALGVVQLASPPGAGDSEAMLDLPALSRVAGQHWMILAAEGGRRLLEQVLLERGARVTRHHVYRRLPASMPHSAADVLAAREPLIVLLASAGALDWMQTMVDHDTWAYLSRQRVVAPSRRVATRARRAGCERVVQAGGADDASMLKAVVEVLKKDGFG